VRSESFWQFFEGIRPQLALRSHTLALVFEHLDQFDRPVGIVETGCMRQAGDWSGDGCSTILFDHYAHTHPGSTVYSVDHSAEATAQIRTLVGPSGRVHTGDSVALLRQLAEERPSDLPSVDLLYLDSFDPDSSHAIPNAARHLQELVSAAPLIHPETLVVVDKSPSSFTGVVDAQGRLQLTSPVAVGGKGKLVAEYAKAVGAREHFQGYQCGWSRMRGDARSTVPVSRHISAVITTSGQGSFAVASDDEFVGRALRASGTYGLDEIQQAARFFSKDEDVLVVGAHVGTVGISLSRLCRRIVLVEANPRTFKLLQCNLLLNEVSNAEALHLAANDREQTLEFVLSTHNSGGSKRMPLVKEQMYFYDQPDIVKVPAASLDAVLPQREFALVFMDIEGSEVFALRGMRRILSTARALIVEFIPHHLKNVAGVTPEQFAAEVQPYFSRLTVPSTGATANRDGFADLLRRMYDAGHGDNGIVFER
jgi:FkbM family methyltransferase